MGGKGQAAPSGFSKDVEIFMQNVYSRCIIVTNRKLCSRPLTEQLERLLPLRPQAVILREQDLPPMEYKELAEQVLALCAVQKVTCFLHSRADIARSLGCRNLHLPLAAAQAMAAASKSGFLGRKDDSPPYFTRLSVSCHSVAEVRQAVRLGASQIVLGTIFPTACKPDHPGAGLDFLRACCREARLQAAMLQRAPVPVYAIGGVTPDKMMQLTACGAAGGCLMSHFMTL